MKLKDYLDRIGYKGPVTPDRTTLAALIQAQVAAVPFENLNQQTDQAVSLDLPNIYDKVVMQNRGGWCFELNGLFGWCLREIGFDVALLSGHVSADRPDFATSGNHMALQVTCDAPLLVDVGFGSSLNAALPLQEGHLHCAPYEVSLQSAGDGVYRYHEHGPGNEGTYWFSSTPVETSHFETANRQLQTDPDSPFKRTLTAQRRMPDRHLILRGLVKKEITATGTTQEVLETPEALIACLKQDFGLEVPGLASRWPVLMNRHQAHFETQE